MSNPAPAPRSWRPFGFRPGLLWVLAFCVCAAQAGSWEPGWETPPRQARLRAYWWWLNGNVTPAAITRDLEEMKAKGFGGALICDAGGAEQRGNAQVPHGPDFGSPAWRELLKHTLREAARLDLEMSLNILSGWNLGGPSVPAADAAKKLVWSEARVSGPGPARLTLPAPASRDGYYQDLFVTAWRLKPLDAGTNPAATVTASSEDPVHPASAMTDGDPATFWVSGGSDPGAGPAAGKPAWARLEFASPVRADALKMIPRPGYGPRECEAQVSEDGKTFRALARTNAAESGETVLHFAPVTARFFRLQILGAYDPRFPKTPRNTQIATLALLDGERSLPEGRPGRRPIQLWREKAVYKALSSSAPDTSPLLRDEPAQPGEEEALASEVLDLTAYLSPGGLLRWDAPEGQWQILRFGCTVGDHAFVSTSSQGWSGYAVDALDRAAFERYWDTVVEPLIADAKPWIGRTLKYLHTDSWEVEAVNWTPTLREEFRRRRGYDLAPYLPALTGRVIQSRPVSNRFLHDFRRTLGDLAAENHYGFFVQRAQARGLSIHPESGGPHAVPIDAQQCLGAGEVPMSEFWAWSWEHRIGDSNRFFVKQPASAAHTYGHRFVAAEGFTTIGPHWQETLWDNLKPSFDRALCEGMNLLFWHAFVCSPEEMGLPGQQYFAGTHFNPNTTWWPKSGAFLSYINRCQWMLQQGLFSADALYYYGDHVPNFTQLKRTDPARVLPGCDYDVITADALLSRLSARDGRLLLPDGMSYRLLAIPDRPAISLPVLRKLRELVQGGATLLGSRPAEASGLAGHPQSDADVREIAAELWGPAASPAGEHRLGRGRVIWGRTAREVLQAGGIEPDFAWTGGDAQTALDYIHRAEGSNDLYFVANRSNRWEHVNALFRVAGKAPELWDPVAGSRKFAAAFAPAGSRTAIPLELPPFGSCFVVFREPAAAHPATAPDNNLRLAPAATLDGPWTVHFPFGMSAPERDSKAMASSATRPVVFDTLASWTTRAEPGIKYYSGAATYQRQIEIPAALRQPGRRVWLDLGHVRELAQVRVNGVDLGVLWAAPFCVEITRALRDGPNSLQVEVVNFWPNRIIGDQFLPPEKQFTRTNVRKLTRATPLMDSGLLGPVTLLTQEP